MQIAILCNFVTLTINFIRMPISDILFLRFSAYFTKKRTAPPPHAEGRRIRRHEFLCMITISKNTPRRAVTKMQLWIYCTPPRTIRGVSLYKKTPAAKTAGNMFLLYVFVYTSARLMAPAWPLTAATCKERLCLPWWDPWGCRGGRRRPWQTVRGSLCPPPSLYP